MRKKVETRNLDLGMYVAELDRPWTSTHYIFQGFEITSKDTLRDLQATCEYVYIDTDPHRITGNPVRHASPAPSARDLGIKKDESPPPTLTTDVLSGPPKLHQWKDKTNLEEEIAEAREIEAKVREMLYTTLDDVRLGRNIDSEGTKAVVADMVESIIRNPDAMMVLSQLKNADEYTALHSLRVCILSLTFGRHLDMTREEMNLLGIGALLHDVGKMKVPSEILNKHGNLTDKEYEIMKNHVPWGVEVLENARGIHPLSIEVAARHHERYGGGGYALGLRGDSIGAFGMIGGIADCYDAITSDRVYHKGMTSYDALSKLYHWRATAFHPGLVEQFIQCMGVYPIGSLVELSTGAIGVVVTVNRERRLKPRVRLVLNADKEPYENARIIDLMDSKEGALAEIKSILPSGQYGITPTDYLPIMTQQAAAML